MNQKYLEANQIINKYIFRTRAAVLIIMCHIASLQRCVWILLSKNPWICNITNNSNLRQFTRRSVYLIKRTGFRFTINIQMESKRISKCSLNRKNNKNEFNTICMGGKQNYYRNLNRMTWYTEAFTRVRFIKLKKC